MHGSVWREIELTPDFSLWKAPGWRCAANSPENVGAQNAEDVEWCDRVLLARIHRLTLGKLRREVEPVSAADFIKFLIHWQHATPGARLRGRDGVLRVIEQLQGLELPAPAWEQHVLPARIENYDPADLEHLCLSGIVAWGRLRNDTIPEEVRGGPKTSPGKRMKRLLAPARNAPIAFLLREEMANYLEPLHSEFKNIPSLSTMALEVARYLDQHGASFLVDIAKETGLLKVKVEEALWQLVAHGLATGDGIAGLRVLLTAGTEAGRPAAQFAAHQRRAQSRAGDAGGAVVALAHKNFSTGC